MDYFTVVTPSRTVNVLTDEGVEKFTKLKTARTPDKAIAQQLGVPLNTVRGKAQTLKLTQQQTSWWDVEDRVEQLKKLWAEGLSASQIAVRLGAKSRMAVLGKVHRLGLAGRATTLRMKSRRQAKERPEKMVRLKPRHPGNPAFRALLEAEPFVASVEELVIPLKERKTIATLEECSCRWPIGDPLAADFHFCGKQKVAGLSYCEFHARRAFQVATQRKRRPFSEGVTMFSKIMPPEVPA